MWLQLHILTFGFIFFVHFWVAVALRMNIETGKENVLLFFWKDEWSNHLLEIIQLYLRHWVRFCSVHSFIEYSKYLSMYYIGLISLTYFNRNFIKCRYKVVIQFYPALTLQTVTIIFEKIKGKHFQLKLYLHVIWNEKL